MSDDSAIAIDDEPVASPAQRSDTADSTDVADVADVADAATEPPQNNADRIDAVADVALVADLAGDGRGLSWREIDRLAVEVEDAAYHYLRANGLDAEIRRRLLGRVFPEFLEDETGRVWQRLFEADR